MVRKYSHFIGSNQHCYVAQSVSDLLDAFCIVAAMVQLDQVGARLELPRMHVTIQEQEQDFPLV